MNEAALLAALSARAEARGEILERQIPVRPVGRPDAISVATGAPRTISVFEVKVSRADWVRDRKLEEYARVGHLAFVVAPRGLVPRDELPDGWGLLEAVGKRNPPRLVTTKKPIRRSPDPELAIEALIVILTNRRGKEDRVDRLSFWRRARDRIRESGEIGAELRYLIASASSKREATIARREAALRIAEAEFEVVYRAAEAAGLEARSPREIADELSWLTSSRKHRIEIDRARHALERARSALDSALEAVEEYRRCPSSESSPSSPS